MLEDIVVKKLVMEEGKVTALEFSHAKKDYEVIVSSSGMEIALKKLSGLKRNAHYDRETTVLTYFPEHCCGAQGFGMGLSDSCPACDGDEYRQKIDNSALPKGPLTKAIVDLDVYCKKVEQLLGSES
ncbi:hypothetical protein GOV03_01245 [Candidatus Woesearchaeota archaeon]|nr:hypothetical protein [Candidatus Woesearchaeota archaeon]